MNTKKVAIVAVVALAVIGGAAFAFRGQIREAMYEANRPELPPAQPYVPGPEPEPIPEPEPTPEPEPEPTPEPKPEPKPVPKPEPAPAAKAEINLAVPFIVQAPHANWEMPYQEACEEASLIMSAAFFAGERSIGADEADKRILDLVAWQEKTFGYYKDTTAEETAKIARDYFSLKAEVKPIASMEDAKREVAAGKVVILPAAGKMLGNPNFSGDGPLYHMLVVKGYTKDGLIITNDPGTRRGADYVYKPSVLYTAVHDWNGGDVDNGAKVMIVISK